MRGIWKLAPLLALALASACASTSEQRAALGAPDSMGLVLLDCQMKFEFAVESRRYDTGLTTGYERLRQPVPAQSALCADVEDPNTLILAKPNRDLLLLGPLRPGTYLLNRIGTDRAYIEPSRPGGIEVLREEANFKPGTAGTDRIAFVVERGGVAYIGRMTAACELELPEEAVSLLTGNMNRLMWAADDRTWKVTWDRDIHHELVAWERVMVGLKKTPWREPIARRLEFLRAQYPAAP